MQLISIGRRIRVLEIGIQFVLMKDELGENRIINLLFS